MPVTDYDAMAIRLRVVDGEMVAVCAAITVAQEGDLYLNDAHHYALACKFARDHLKTRVDWNDDRNDALAETQHDAGQLIALEEWWERHEAEVRVDGDASRQRL